MSLPPTCYFMAAAAVYQHHMSHVITANFNLQVGGRPQGAPQTSLACSLTTALSSSQRGAQRHRR